jgi:hypothetical protein
VKRGVPIAVPLAVLAALAGAAPPASAQIGAEVFGAFNTYNMEDWNDAIEFANGAGAEIDEINGRFMAGPSLMISGVWEPLFITREDESTGEELKLDGNSIQATVAYFFPTAGNARYGLGAGLGYYMLNGEAESSGGDIDIEGNALGFHLMGLGEWTVSPGFAVTGAAGYRFARIDDTEFDGASTTPKFETDYSGMTLRLGLAFYMGERRGY